MVLPWFYHGFTGFTMVLPWFYHGFTMVLPGFTMVLPWFYHGFTMFSPQNNPKHCGPAQAKPSPLILRRVTTVMASSCTWKDLARQGGKETGVFCVKQKQQKECNYIILYTWFHEFGLRLLVL